MDLTMITKNYLPLVLLLASCGGAKQDGSSSAAALSTNLLGSINALLATASVQSGLVKIAAIDPTSFGSATSKLVTDASFNYNGKAFGGIKTDLAQLPSASWQPGSGPSHLGDILDSQGITAAVSNVDVQAYLQITTAALTSAKAHSASLSAHFTPDEMARAMHVSMVLAAPAANFGLGLLGQETAAQAGSVIGTVTQCPTGECIVDGNDIHAANASIGHYFNAYWIDQYSGATFPICAVDPGKAWSEEGTGAQKHSCRGGAHSLVPPANVSIQAPDLSNPSTATQAASGT